VGGTGLEPVASCVQGVHFLHKAIANSELVMIAGVDDLNRNH